MMSTRERQLSDLLEPAVTGLGYELLGIELESSGPHWTLRAFIDRDEGITVGDCEHASRQIGAVLDVEDPISEPYALEVSSPGLDRPLLTAEHFERFAGLPVRLRTTEPMNGRRGWSGRLGGCRDGSVVVRDGSEEQLIPLGLVEKANLVPEV